MGKKRLTTIFLISAFLLMIVILVGFFYPADSVIMFNKFWPSILIIVGILQTLDTRFKDPESAVLLAVTGVILFIFKFKLLPVEFVLNSWPGSLKKLLLNAFEWLLSLIFGT